MSGSRTRAGAYVVWNCRIETFEVLTSFPNAAVSGEHFSDEILGRTIYSPKTVLGVLEVTRAVESNFP